MRTYTVYIGSAEQFAYTWQAKNLKEIRKMIETAWPSSYAGVRWFKVDASGCPRGAKRWHVGNNPNRPVLILPRR